MNVVPWGMFIVAMLGVIGAALKLLWDAAQFFKGMRDDLHNLATDMNEHVRKDEQQFVTINDDVSVLKLSVQRVQTHLGLD
jgi:ribosome recycling factor